MAFKSFLVAAISSLGVSWAHAGDQVINLGVVTDLPYIEGGLLAVGVAALVVGVRIVRGRNRR